MKLRRRAILENIIVKNLIGKGEIHAGEVMKANLDEVKTYLERKPSSRVLAENKLF